MTLPLQMILTSIPRISDSASNLLSIGISPRRMIAPIFWLREMVLVQMRFSMSSLLTSQPEIPTILPNAALIFRPIFSAVGAFRGLSISMMILSLSPLASPNGDVGQSLTFRSSVSSAGTARPAPSQSTVGSPVFRDSIRGKNVENPPSSTG